MYTPNVQMVPVLAKKPTVGSVYHFKALCEYWIPHGLPFSVAALLSLCASCHRGQPAVPFSL